MLRLTNTYGPRMRVKDDRQTFLGTWLRLAVEGEELLVFGDGTQQRDFTYVDDAVEAFLLAGLARRRTARCSTSAASRLCRLAELAELLVELAGAGSWRLVPFPDERRTIDIGDYFADDTKIRARLGWEPPSGCARGSSGRSPTTATTGRRLLVAVPFLDLRRQADADERRARGGVREGRRPGPVHRRAVAGGIRGAVLGLLLAPHAVGVNSGTDAIALALRALGVGPGDEVITAANTCVATVTGIAASGATTVLADVDE